MFLAIDECKDYGKQLLGLVALPQSKVPDFERDFCALRLATKTMGEISWTKVTKTYLNKYISFVDLFLDNPDATFHAITYSQRSKYQAAYSLIRVTSKKLWYAGVKQDRELFILFDEDKEAFPKPEVIDFHGTKMVEVQEFENSYDAIQKIAKKDGRFWHKICFCHQGASHQFGILQITDILTGAVCAVINNKADLSEEHAALIKHIRSKIGHDFDASRLQPAMPALKDYKIHFLDPLSPKPE